MNEKLNACDVLQKRRPKALSQEWCVMCKQRGESINHFFLHYEVAWCRWVQEADHLVACLVSFNWLFQEIEESKRGKDLGKCTMMVFS